MNGSLCVCTSSSWDWFLHDIYFQSYFVIKNPLVYNRIWNHDVRIQYSKILKKKNNLPQTSDGNFLNYFRVVHSALHHFVSGTKIHPKVRRVSLLGEPRTLGSTLWGEGICLLGPAPVITYLVDLRLS